MVDLVKSSHFLGSGMTCERVLFVQKWPFFTKSAIKNPNPYFFAQNFDMSNFFGCQSIHRHIESIKNSKYVEHGQILIGRWVEPDKSRCILVTLHSVNLYIFSTYYIFTYRKVASINVRY